MPAIFHRDQVAARMVAHSHLALASSLKDGEAKEHHLKFVAEVQEWLDSNFQGARLRHNPDLVIMAGNLSVPEAWR